MKNVKVLWVIIILLMALSGFLVNKFIRGNVAPSVDGRISVVLTNDERNFILEEMRQFLVSVQGVSSAITNKDLKTVEQLAHKAGMAAEANTPGAILQKLPLGMKTLGFGTRGLFDDIASAAKEGKEPLALRKQLDALMNNCIACHSAYRLPEPKG